VFFQNYNRTVSKSVEECAFMWLLTIKIFK